MHTNDEEKYDLLINTNPVAYNELIDFVPEYGQKAYKKETLPSDTDIYFGEWKCPSGKHTWISTIKYRSNEENDPGCPICKNNNLGLNPKLLAFRNHFSTFRTWIESLWYCDKCYAFYWAKEVRDTHTFERHNLSQCRPGQQTLKEEFPNIAEEWSDKNLIPADKICYNFNNDYKFIWNCRKCGMEYKSSMKNNVYFSRKENACPYCAGEIPFPNESLAAQYPQIAKQWHYNLNKNRILNLDDDEEITPEKTFPDNRSWGYFTCPNCGVIRVMDVGDLIAEKECPYCAAGMTKEYSSVLYKELEYTGITYINPEQKQSVTFRCHIYGRNYNASPIDIFYMKKLCPYCNGKEAVPGKTSFKALYPELVSEYSNENEKDPDNFLPTSSFDAIWICSACGMQWNAAIKNRVENIEICPYCDGRRVIPNKTSLYALFQELICREWKYQSNILIVDPRMEFPDSNKQAWWKCNICGRTYSSPIKQRVRDYKCNRNSCTYCKGHIRIKYRN